MVGRDGKVHVIERKFTEFVNEDDEEKEKGEEKETEVNENEDYEAEDDEKKNEEFEDKEDEGEDEKTSSMAGALGNNTIKELRKAYNKPDLRKQEAFDQEKFNFTQLMILDPTKIYTVKDMNDSEHNRLQRAL